MDSKRRWRAFKKPKDADQFDFFVARLGKSSLPKIVLVHPDLHDLTNLPYKPKRMKTWIEQGWFNEFMNFIAGQEQFREP